MTGTVLLLWRRLGPYHLARARAAKVLFSEYGLQVLGRGDEAWKKLMLAPRDYTRDSIMHPATRALMEKITFEHGGPDYDEKYPDGIPT